MGDGNNQNGNNQNINQNKQKIQNYEYAKYLKHLLASQKFNTNLKKQNMKNKANEIIRIHNKPQHTRGLRMALETFGPRERKEIQSLIGKNNLNLNEIVSNYSKRNGNNVNVNNNNNSKLSDLNKYIKNSGLRAKKDILKKMITNKRKGLARKIQNYTQSNINALYSKLPKWSNSSSRSITKYLIKFIKDHNVQMSYSASSSNPKLASSTVNKILDLLVKYKHRFSLFDLETELRQLHRKQFAGHNQFKTKNNSKRYELNEYICSNEFKNISDPEQLIKRAKFTSFEKTQIRTKFPELCGNDRIKPFKPNTKDDKKKKGEKKKGEKTVTFNLNYNRDFSIQNPNKLPPNIHEYIVNENFKENRLPQKISHIHASNLADWVLDNPKKTVTPKIFNRISKYDTHTQLKDAIIKALNAMYDTINNEFKFFNPSIALSTFLFNLIQNTTDIPTIDSIIELFKSKSELKSGLLFTRGLLHLIDKQRRYDLIKYFLPKNVYNKLSNSQKTILNIASMSKNINVSNKTSRLAINLLIQKGNTRVLKKKIYGNLNARHQTLFEKTILNMSLEDLFKNIDTFKKYKDNYPIIYARALIRLMELYNESNEKEKYKNGYDSKITQDIINELRDIIINLKIKNSVIKRELTTNLIRFANENWFTQKGNTINTEVLVKKLVKGNNVNINVSKLTPEQKNRIRTYIKNVKNQNHLKKLKTKFNSIYTSFDKNIAASSNNYNDIVKSKQQFLDFRRYLPDAFKEKTFINDMKKIRNAYKIIDKSSLVKFKDTDNVFAFTVPENVSYIFEIQDASNFIVGYVYTLDRQTKVYKLNTRTQLLYQYWIHQNKHSNDELVIFDYPKKPITPKQIEDKYNEQLKLRICKYVYIPKQTISHINYFTCFLTTQGKHTNIEKFEKYKVWSDEYFQLLENEGVDKKYINKKRILYEQQDAKKKKDLLAWLYNMYVANKKGKYTFFNHGKFIRDGLYAKLNTNNSQKYYKIENIGNFKNTHTTHNTQNTNTPMTYNGIVYLYSIPSFNKNTKKLKVTSLNKSTNLHGIYVDFNEPIPKHIQIKLTDIKDIKEQTIQSKVFEKINSVIKYKPNKWAGRQQDRQTYKNQYFLNLKNGTQSTKNQETQSTFENPQQKTLTQIDDKSKKILLLLNRIYGFNKTLNYNYNLLPQLAKLGKKQLKKYLKYKNYYQLKQNLQKYTNLPAVKKDELNKILNPRKNKTNEIISKLKLNGYFKNHIHKLPSAVINTIYSKMGENPDVTHYKKEILKGLLYRIYPESKQVKKYVNTLHAFPSSVKFPNFHIQLIDAKEEVLKKQLNELLKHIKNDTEKKRVKEMWPVNKETLNELRKKYNVHSPFNANQSNSEQSEQNKIPLVGPLTELLKKQKPENRRQNQINKILKKHPEPPNLKNKLNKLNNEKLLEIYKLSESEKLTNQIKANL